MAAATPRPVLVVVSPFLDKRHGTERRVVEWISQLADTFEIHVYSQRVEDLDLSRIVWHRIPRLPGPHLLNFLWWFAANHLWRSWDRRVRGHRHDLVLTPGTNCLDADVVSVHIVFAEFYRRVRPELNLAGNPIRFWPRLIHRRLYYRLIALLERRIYTNPGTALVSVSRKTAASLGRFYGRGEHAPVLYLGIDHAIFNPGRRMALREEARNSLGLPEGCFVLLLIGNDLHNKGIRVLLDALALLPDLPIHLVAAGSDNSAPFRAMALERNIGGRVHFHPPREDVLFYYAAADAYAGPSLEDAFALPPAEAMACGLPVIVTATNGASEIILDGADGVILGDPSDSGSLAAMIRRLFEDAEFRGGLAARAAATARRFTWENNGRELAAIFEEILGRKANPAAQEPVREP